MASCLRHYTLTVAATNAVQAFEPNVFSAYLRCPLTNAGTTYVCIDESPANATSGIPLAPGDTITIDLSQAIQNADNKGILTQEKFIRSLSFIGTAADILNVEVLTWV